MPTKAAKRPAPSDQQQTSIPPPLTFPRPIFAALNPHPFLRAHLSASTTSDKTQKAPLRANNRAPSECRTPQFHTGSLTHCNGSAVVRLGNTVAVCGVRAEILSSESDEEVSLEESEEEGDLLEADKSELEEKRLLVPNIEISTGSTPSLIPGNAPSAFQQTLTTRIRNLLLSTHLVRARDLRILHTANSGGEGVDGSGAGEGDTKTVVVKGHWVLYIDTLFISLDGNAFDAAWLGILAALRDARVPRAYFDEEIEGIVCSDRPAEASPLRLYGLPVPSTFAVFEGQTVEGEPEEDAKDYVLSDPDAFEESVCMESVCVVVDQDSVRKIEKSGGGVVDREIMRGLIGRAKQNWGVWKKELEGVA